MTTFFSMLAIHFGFIFLYFMIGGLFSMLIAEMGAPIPVQIQMVLFWPKNLIELVIGFVKYRVLGLEVPSDELDLSEAIKEAMDKAVESQETDEEE